MGDERRCVDRLKTLGYLAEMKPGFDESAVLQAMTAQVTETSESDVRAHLEGLQRTFENTEDPREREAVAFFLAQCYVILDAEEESRRYLKPVIIEGSQSETIAHLYGWALVTAGEFENALSFCAEWLQIHPSDSYMSGPKGVAICALGRVVEGFDLIEQYIKLELCPHCTKKILHKAVVALDQKMTPQLEYIFWQRFLANGAGAEATNSQIHAAVSILGRLVPANRRGAIFAQAARAWKQLSMAPSWFLWNAVCPLSHYPEHHGLVLEVILAIAGDRTDPLHQYVVDHLVEILPQLKHAKDVSGEKALAYSNATMLLRTRATAERLAAGFRFSAPVVAKRSPESIRDLFDIYTEWLREGLIPEPITPYSEAIAVLAAADPLKELQTLHPETRDAVSLLLGALQKESKSKDEISKQVAKRTPDSAVTVQ